MAFVNFAHRSDEKPADQPEAADTALLNFLRFVAMECRAKRRTDLFEACALLHVSGRASREAHADALMRCLNEAVGTRVTLFAPGTAEVSFDEAWLLQLARALDRNDDASTAFLLNSRVATQHRRLVRYLVGHIAKHFDLS